MTSKDLIVGNVPRMAGNVRGMRQVGKKNPSPKAIMDILSVRGVVTSPRSCVSDTSNFKMNHSGYWT